MTEQQTSKTDTYTCVECEGNKPLEERYTTYSGLFICEDCYYESYFRCDNCDEIFLMDDSRGCDSCDIYLCESCYDYHFDDEHVGGEYRTQSVNYADESLSVFEAGERITDERRFGVELEAEFGANPSGDIINDLIPSQCGVTEDGSLNNGVEVQTPPLTGKVGEEFVKDTCREMRSVTEAQRTCGTHIHLEAEDYKNNPVAFSYLWYFVYCIEPIILAMLPKSRHNSTYCLSMRRLPKPSLMRTKKRVRGVEKGGKFMGFGIGRIDWAKTLEVRYHSGTLDSRKVIEWVVLWQAILRNAKSIRFNQSLKIAMSEGEDKLSLFFDAIKADAITRDYVRERINGFNQFEMLAKEEL